MANPEAWAPTGGFTGIGVHLLPSGLRAFAIPLLVAGVLLLVVAWVLTVRIKKADEQTGL